MGSSCGTCTSPQTCGGGGTPGVCGTGNCTPFSCAQQNITCGPAGDGCGNAIDCARCTGSNTCGGGGVPGQCGHPTCQPLTCAQQSVSCGSAGNTGSSQAGATAATASKGTEPATTAAATQGAGGVPVSANRCPSAVPGSTTTVTELADGVEVRVTVAGGAPINDIRQRGVQIVAAARDPASGGGGSATDGLARCPVIVKDTTVTETDVPGGAAFTVKPAKAGGVAALKMETKSRAAGYAAEVPR